MSIHELNEQVINCIRCPRLVEYRERVAREKVKRFRNEEYWGRPAPGFGDDDPELLVIGLAPAAHGANRTGRMFTGDSSGDWLYKALYETGFANQPHSYAVNDGLQLMNAYVTASVRCAPPNNKPLPEEIANCRSYLEEEIRLFKRAGVYLTLGQIAFKNVCALFKMKGLKFGHNQLHTLSNGRFLLTSYHPSRQNTQTGFLKWDDWLGVFKRAKELISHDPPPGIASFI